MKKNKIYLAIVLLVVAVGMTLGVISFLTKDKVAYVDMPVLYNEFTMTKHLDEEYQDILKKRNQIVDSLKEELTNIFHEGMNQSEEALFMKKREVYLEKLQKFEEENTSMNSELTSKIWKRLDEYIKKYGKEKRYDFIYGANGQGNLLFASDKKDLTKDLAEYCNKAYLGDKK